MDNTTQPVSTYTPASFGGAPRKSSNKNKLIILIVVVLALLLGTWFFLSRSSSEDADSGATTTIAPLPTSEVMEEPTEDPEASPAAEADENTDSEPAAEVTVAQDMKIQVQNGSGEEGVAGSAQTHLNDKGYDSVETANADNFDYTGVTVQVKAAHKKFLSTLVKDLEEKYTVSDQSSDLDDSSDFDAIVIVGK